MDRTVTKRDSLIRRGWQELTKPFKLERPSQAFAEEEVYKQAVKQMGFGLGSRVNEAPKEQKKQDNLKGILLRIWSYLLFHRAQLIGVLCLIVIGSGLSLLAPLVVGHIIDHQLTAGKDGLITMLIILGVLYIAQAIVAYTQNSWMITISQQTVYRLRNDIFSQFQKLPIRFFSKRQQGDLMSRATNDIDNISSTLNSTFIQLSSSALMLTGIVIIMLILSPILTLLTFCIVPLMLIGMRWITSHTSKLFRIQQRNIGRLNGFVEESLSGQKVIKSFSQEQHVISKFSQSNKNIRLSGYWAQAISGFIPKLMNGLNGFSFALVVGVGALLNLWNDSVTIGTIIIFAEYARQFTRPLNDLANQWNTMLSAIAGAERIFKIMDEPIETVDETGAVPVEQIKGDVRFKNVNFAYEQNEPTLAQINLDIKAGETIALVGPTGAGKTTVISLLSRFYEVTEGMIYIDGRPITSITRQSLRSQMGFVLQDPYLFAGTIMDNIRYGKIDATDEEVIEAAKRANAHSFIVRLKDGYQTQLALGGNGISHGQKQLIAIARALIANPSILVLDEATSSIDTVTEIKIQDALHTLMQGRTSFVIAHRLNTIQSADKIAVLKQGRLVQFGSHTELLREEGMYRDLVEGQIILE